MGAMTEKINTDTWPDCHQHSLLDCCRAAVFAGSILAEKVDAGGANPHALTKMADFALSCALHASDADEALSGFDEAAGDLKDALVSAAARDGSGVVYRHPLTSAAVLSFLNIRAHEQHSGSAGSPRSSAAHGLAEMLLEADPVDAEELIAAVMSPGSYERTMMARNAHLN